MVAIRGFSLGMESRIWVYSYPGFGSLAFGCASGHHDLAISELWGVPIFLPVSSQVTHSNRL
jgi:hypothetical protein